jgi:signal transduction histidine kinase
MTPPLHTARLSEAAGIRAAAAGVAVQRFLQRPVQGLSWRRIGAVILFCGVFGFVLSVDPSNGGHPASMSAYVSGYASALKLFGPALVAVTVAASFAPLRFASRVLTLGAAVTVGIAAGYCVMTGIPGLIAGWRSDRLDLLVIPLPFLGLGWLGLFVYLLEERAQNEQRSLHAEIQRQLDMERQMSEAQLQVLQSQIEPHFLFNSLAHVRRLYLTSPSAASTMMRDLVQYLGAIMSALRSDGIELGEDVKLAVAYLNLQKVRMGARLTFHVDVEPAASDARVPPMMMTTLVENAIKHGLTELPEGGTIRISAVTQDELVAVKVSDTGVGLQKTFGTGVGLANTRARLAILHGSVASLTLVRNTPSGVTVAIDVPRHPREPAPV